MNTYCPLCPCGEEFFHAHGSGFYVSVQDAGKTGLLAGPFTTHAEALRHVEDVREAAYKADSRAHFYAFGTLAIKDGERKPGILNKRLGL